MNPELEGMLKKGCGWLPRRASFYISAVLVGCQISGIALAAGTWISRGKFDHEVAMLLCASPMLLGSGSLCANAIVLGLAFGHFVQLENLNFRDWGIFAGLEAFFTFHSIFGSLHGWLAWTVSVSLWLLLMTMLGVSTWFLRRWQLDRLAAEIEMLKSKNSARRAYRESRGDFSVSLPSPEDPDNNHL